MNLKEVKLSQELLVVLYIWGFTFLKPLLQNNLAFSTVILFFYSFFIIILSIIKIKKIKIKSLKLVFIVFIIFVLDALFRFNEYTLQYFYEFIIYAIIPIYLISQIKDPKLFLKIFAYISVLAVILFGADPLNDYEIFQDYMPYGFELALPAFLGVHLGRRFLKIRWMLLFEIITLVLIYLFASRSPILGVILFLFLTEYFTQKSGVKSKLKLSLFLVVVIIAVVNFEIIIDNSLQYLSQFGIYSTNLERLSIYLDSQNNDKLFSGRIDIWGNAFEMFIKNPFIGAGTGAFQANYGFYSHNIILDVLLQYGFIGFVLFFTAITKSFINIIKSQLYIKLLGLLFFSLWFPKLFFSLYFYKEIGFWLFLAYGLFLTKNLSQILSPK